MKMKIEIVTASSAPSALMERTSHRSDEWDAVAERLLDAKRGDWLRVLLNDAPGKSLKNKQGNLISAMRVRKLRIDTRVLGSHLWFRVKQEDGKSEPV